MFAGSSSYLRLGTFVSVVVVLPASSWAQAGNQPKATDDTTPVASPAVKVRAPRKAKDPNAPARTVRVRGITYIRFLHAIPSGPVVDVFVDGDKKVDSVSFRSLTEYLALPSGSRTVVLKKAGTEETLGSIKKSGQADKYYVLAAVTIDGKPGFVWQNEVTGKPRAGRASLRVYHLASGAPSVRITTPAARGKDKVRNLVKELPFGKSRSVSLAPGTATLQVRNGQDLIKDAAANVEAEKRYAAFAVGEANALEIILKPVGK